jgi:hypothetical protein
MNEKDTRKEGFSFQNDIFVSVQKWFFIIPEYANSGKNKPFT